MLVTKLKASSSCSAVSSVNFSSDAKFIVTAGKKHLKFWTVRSSPGNRLNAGTVSLAMHGKLVDLGPQKGSSFVSVTSHKWSGGSFVNGEQAGDFFPIYALTDTGWIYFRLSPRFSMYLRFCCMGYESYSFPIVYRCSVPYTFWIFSKEIS